MLRVRPTTVRVITTPRRAAVKGLSEVVLGIPVTAWRI
jgi:hypothetical protein